MFMNRRLLSLVFLFAIWLEKGGSGVTKMIEVQVNIFMVILLLSVAVHAYLNFNRRERAQQAFFGLLVLTILVLVLEILSVLLNSPSYQNLLVLHKIVDAAGFAIAPLVSAAVALFVYHRAKQHAMVRAGQKKWLSLPLLINTFFALGSYQYNWIFHITNENLYVRGPLFFLSPISVCFYYGLAFWILYGNRRRIVSTELFSLTLLAAIPLLLSAFQLYYFVYLTIWNSLAIAVTINYMFILHNQTRIDPLTGLGNRLAHDEYLASMSRKSKLVVAVVNIDLDNFKNINNAYGHHEGDRVLRAFAQELKAVFEGFGEPLRVGGDEFIVWVHTNDRALIEGYLKTLTTRLSAGKSVRQLPYPVSFSYGITVFSDSYKNLQEFIQHSDRLMYEAKHRKRLHSQWA
jgi:diguanylate cyclase (GGDEF)-like protein